MNQSSRKEKSEKRRFPTPASQGNTLLGRTKSMLRFYGLTVRKSLGQNFLTDEDALELIIQTADLHSDDLVMEVGPGLGVLTNELAKHAGRVLAVEIDPQVVSALSGIFAEQGNVKVLQSDILAVDLAELTRSEGLLAATETDLGDGSWVVKHFKLVANLPYYITSLVLRHFLESTAKPEIMVLMLQKEVAQRIVARPGNMSLLAVSVQVYGRPQIISYVPAQSFFPAPKVDSAILRIDVYPQPLVPQEELVRFFEVVHAGFSQARKQLHNSISRAMWLPPGGGSELLRAAGIDPERRPQTLSIEEWLAISRELPRMRDKLESTS